jgi:hypothetical protein
VREILRIVTEMIAARLAIDKAVRVAGADSHERHGAQSLMCARYVANRGNQLRRRAP